MKKTLTYILLFAPAVLFAQDRKTLTLEICQQAALHSNQLIKNTERLVEVAKLDLKASKAAALPGVSLVGTGLYGFSPLLPALPPFWSAPLNNLYAGGLHISQPIYSGGRLRSAAGLATVGLNARNLSICMTADSLLLSVSVKYWQLVGIQEQQKKLRANVRLLESLLKLQRELHEQGMVAQNDKLKIAVQLSKLTVAMLKAEHARIATLQDLCSIAGLDYDENMHMSDTLGKSTPAGPLAPDPSILFPRRLQLSAYAVDIARLELNNKRGAMYPAIAGNFTAAQVGSFGGGGKGHFLPVASVGISVPLSAWWADGRANVRKAEWLVTIAQAGQSLLFKTLKLELNKSWYACVEASAEIKLAEELVAQSAENYRVLQDGYRSGVASVSELIEAQVLHQEAQVQLVMALAGFEVCMAGYQFLLRN